MPHSIRRGSDEQGQVLVLAGLVLALMIFGSGLAIDGGNGLAQRRAAQNAADFAAMAGARVVAQYISGDTTNGTDANVVAAITTTIARNGGSAATFGAAGDPRYVSASGALLGFVGAGSIPGPTCSANATACAAGVQASSNRQWKPFFLGLFGVNQWSTSAIATAKGGYSQGAPAPGSLFPAGISLAFFNTYPACDDEVGTKPACNPQHLTPGNLNVPGGFGWLKFGCDGYGLGQDPPANAGGCGNSKPFLQGEIDGPNTYGCCSAISTPGLDQIGSLPGNKASADCSYYINHKITVTVPIWDTAGGTGSNAWYHIVGYAGFQITACSGGKDIEGVWRLPFFYGPVSVTPGVGGVPQALGVQLVK